MKYQVDPPILVIVRPAVFPSAQVSRAHWTVVDWQNLPVRSEVAVAEASIARFFSCMRLLTARPTPELARSTIASTPSASTHRCAIATPMSGLF
jgi:hypothetical protein